MALQFEDTTATRRKAYESLREALTTRDKNKAIVAQEQQQRSTRGEALQRPPVTFEDNTEQRRGPEPPSPYGGQSLGGAYGDARNISPGSVAPAQDPSPYGQSTLGDAYGTARQGPGSLPATPPGADPTALGALRQQAEAAQYTAAGQGYHKDPKTGVVSYRGQATQSRERSPVRAHSPDAAIDPRTNAEFLRDRVALYQQRANESTQAREDRLFQEGQGIAAKAGVGTPEAQAGRERDAAGTGLTMTQDIERTSQDARWAHENALRSEIGEQPVPHPDGPQKGPAATALADALGGARAPEVGAYNGEQIDPEVAKLGDIRKATDIKSRVQERAQPEATAGYQAQGELSSGLMTDAGEFAPQMTNYARQIDAAKTVGEKLKINGKAIDALNKLKATRKAREDKQAESNRKFEADKADSQAKTARANADFAAAQQTANKAGMVGAAKTMVEQADLDLASIKKYIIQQEAIRDAVIIQGKGTVAAPGADAAYNLLHSQGGLYEQAAALQKAQRAARKKLADTQKGVPIDPEEGKTATGPNGEQIIKRDGKWEPLN